MIPARRSARMARVCQPSPPPYDLDSAGAIDFLPVMLYCSCNQRKGIENATSYQCADQ